MTEQQETLVGGWTAFHPLTPEDQKVFDEACKVAPAVYWTADGVHPTLAGAKLMAQAWLKAVKR